MSFYAAAYFIVLFVSIVIFIVTLIVYPVVVMLCSYKCACSPVFCQKMNNKILELNWWDSKVGNLVANFGTARYRGHNVSPATPCAPAWHI